MAAVDDVADRVGVQAGEPGQLDLGDALFLDQGHDRIAPSRHWTLPVRVTSSRILRIRPASGKENPHRARFEPGVGFTAG